MPSATHYCVSFFLQFKLHPLMNVHGANAFTFSFRKDSMIYSLEKSAQISCNNSWKKRPDGVSTTVKYKQHRPTFEIVHGSLSLSCQETTATKPWDSKTSRGNGSNRSLIRRYRMFLILSWEVEDFLGNFLGGRRCFAYFFGSRCC